MGAAAMVYSDDTAGFHFDAQEFNDLLAEHGTDAELRLAKRCACWGIDTGRPDPACELCYPFGYLYAAPVAMRVHGPNRKPMKQLEQDGVIDLGDAMFTLPSAHQPPHYSRLSLTGSVLTVDETLRRGKEETLRFSRVLAVLGAHTVTRDPDGTVHHVPLAAGTDYVVNLTTRRVTWPNGSAVADGARVVFVCRVISEWILWEAKDRAEGGALMPYQYLAKRLDYLLQPRGKSEGATF